MGATGMIYHITTKSEWQTAQQAGSYQAPSLTDEGFIHFSQKHQILPVANAFYRNVPDLIILCVDEDKLTSPVKYEAPVHPSNDDAGDVDESQLFPHVYGTVNLDAVSKVVDFPAQVDGSYQLPVTL